MIGVLHHLPGDEAKQDILAQISKRLKPTAPLVIAGNYRAYASQPLLMAAWAKRWRMNGEEPEEVQSRMGKLLQGADPPESEEAVTSLLTDAGFEEPVRFFASLFWGALLAERISPSD
jgi:tRNA (cmo5U34)-methyltransferase